MPPAPVPSPVVSRSGTHPIVVRPVATPAVNAREAPQPVTPASSDEPVTPASSDEPVTPASSGKPVDAAASPEAVPVPDVAPASPPIPVSGPPVVGVGEPGDADPTVESDHEPDHDATVDEPALPPTPETDEPVPPADAGRTADATDTARSEQATATGTDTRTPGDPEQMLAAYRWRLDPETLRETVGDPDELRALRGRLTEKLAVSLDNRARARLLSLRAVVSRVVGDLDDALADGRLALTYAEATGELRRTALARARLAEVLRRRGEHAEADRLFVEANSAELPDRLRSAMHEHAGRSCYDQGRLMEACEHFERALDLRRVDDPELTERIKVSLDAVHARAVAEGGFGPYPRSREEVLRGHRSPAPTRDSGPGRWGYADVDGELVIDYRYAEAQPFCEGVAWVRRPDTIGWELIDEAGTTLIAPAYVAVRAFSDGLAWVSRGGDADWTAIEPDGTELASGGFEEVRSFRGGVAAVRRGGAWGAVDRHGRLVVPLRYQGFRTVLADGRPVDGFTDEGLAVVEAGGLRGVVDRTGRVLVAPAHPQLMIHPVAFLATDRAGRWGALDRRGAPLIDPVHPGRDAVLAEIDLLLADTHPVL
ncbi:WG repeat-containing protein [Micromonospora sp. KC723]|uniref:WG repeat-containing protein n=1 Tax=Micromonospora sp. KC723 TaxID=2530381 RepID=UPI001FB79F35|nr:WG repeat-containing protein [Micromonospora sp. KC723]